jgi:hypothetical protein
MRLIDRVFKPYLKTLEERKETKSKKYFESFLKDGKDLEKDIEEYTKWDSFVYSKYDSVYDGFHNAVRKYFREIGYETWISGNATGLDLHPKKYRMFEFLLGNNEISTYKHGSFKPNTRFNIDPQSVDRKVASLKSIDNKSWTFATRLKYEYQVKKGVKKRHDDDPISNFDDLTRSDLFVCMFLMNQQIKESMKLIDELRDTVYYKHDQSLQRYRKNKAYQGFISVLLGLPNKKVDELVLQAQENSKEIQSILKNKNKLNAKLKKRG